ncbi:MAG: TRAP transporter small permease [Betaproteobacteria bacterium]|nr:TRAP transporter small permease [Betaproteobacteria bacterium]
MSAHPTALGRFNAALSRYALYACVAGLAAIVAVVAFQVFGRYVMNDSPTWTENLALVLILYVTLIGAAVGVRDAGHLGMDSLLVLASAEWQRRLGIAIHVCVGTFGALMAWNGAVLGESVMSYKLANIDLPESVRYVPLVISGLLIVLFSVEHAIALVRRTQVTRAWH